ncbi:hypothetical protein QJS83_02435 [Bdellovibrio sp. 22V]|uniref:hypothetical protein n=1 Tax=Bdellovibrio TaxID=958 RepID=UPI002543842D|nr:hypothetical protein [Bdellovibrio sp. 22V]WII72727.1 hypothetical protein QJS83_02435 [Bdellovibrio sp. 22V]
MKSFNSQSEPTTEMQIVHHFGADAVPVHNGVVTAYDFAHLEKKSKLLRKLGDKINVTFKTKNCETFGDDLYSCSSSDPIEINGLDIKGYSVVTRLVETKVYEYSFKAHQVVFSFLFEGMNYDIPMSYSPEECRFKN